MRRDLSKNSGREVSSEGKGGMTSLERGEDRRVKKGTQSYRCKDFDGLRIFNGQR